MFNNRKTSLMTKYIIDTDPGTDDAVAFIAALNSPELDILALTTVGGNASLQDTTRNALDLMTLLGRPDMPVYRGAESPLTGEFPFAYDFHGPGGLSVPIPSSQSEPRPETAADYIQNAALEHSGDLVIVALGPLTNIAQAFIDRPNLRDHVKELIVMGGAIEVPGNITPHAEFNTYCDPRAANVVFRSGVPVTLIGLDVCREVFFTRDGDWSSGKSPSERIAARLVRGWFDIHTDRDHFDLCDPLAIAAVLDPSLIEYRPTTVHAVEVGDQVGKTIAGYGPGSTKVALRVQANQATQLIRDRLKPHA